MIKKAKKMTVFGVIGKIFAIFTRSKLVQAAVHEVFL
jgi:hypothetical protein